MTFVGSGPRYYSSSVHTISNHPRFLFTDCCFNVLLFYVETNDVVSHCIVSYRIVLYCTSGFVHSRSRVDLESHASLYFISKMLKGAHLPNVYLNGVLVERVDSVKYLGHFLTCELSDAIDIGRECRVFNVRGNSLCRKFHMCSVPAKLKLFN